MSSDFVEGLLGKKHSYDVVSPSDFKDGHGSGLSVKVVLPSYCQARCPFCFNNLTTETQQHNYAYFFKNLIDSLNLIFKNINDRPISIDITGNEPTFDTEVFKKFMAIISEYKPFISKVVLTTNGFRLGEVIGSMKGVVDIVNISLHHYDYNERRQIFGTNRIPSNEELKELVSRLHNNGITATAVSVLYKDLGNFRDYCDKFKDMAIETGFKDVRMRSNFCANDEFIYEILRTDFNNDSINIVGGLVTKIITDKKTGFQTYILKGVPDLTEYVVGAELVIDDDGLCYVDYNKRYPVNDGNIRNFNNMYIFNDQPLDKKLQLLKRRITTTEIKTK